MSVVYRLHNNKGKWLAFDVSVGGVSLVQDLQDRLDQ